MEAKKTSAALGIAKRLRKKRSNNRFYLAEVFFRIHSGRAA